MYATTNSASLLGLNVQLIQVEVDYRFGLAHFVVVGLPDKAVQEARERIASAIRNSGCEFIPQRIVVNLAPADIPKVGPIFDLAIAVGLLAATEQLNCDLSRSVFLGELSLDGGVKPISGVLPLVCELMQMGFESIFIPEACAEEVRALELQRNIYPVSTLAQVYRHLLGSEKIPSLSPATLLTTAEYKHDFEVIKGQVFAKHALEVAACGGHNVLMSGSPGAGKTMLAKAFASILPAMSVAEQIDVSKIYSVAGLLSKQSPIISSRPFRSPHHTASAPALIGGGSMPKPGEVSLAHHGVLFLDELPEFPLQVIDSLRQPIEDRQVVVSRATRTLVYPAKFQLIATMNPCKCGFFGTQDGVCKCSPQDVKKYRKRVSGPILDRFDMRIAVPKLKWEELNTDDSRENSNTIRSRVETARRLQYQRLGDGRTNAEMTTKEVDTYVKLDSFTQDFLQQVQQKYGFSVRGYHRLLKVARSVADLQDSLRVEYPHVIEAVSYRAEI